MELSERECRVLRDLAECLLKSMEESGYGYWMVGTTVIEEEVELLKKIAK